MKKLLRYALQMSCVVALTFSFSSMSHAADVTGTWKTIDDKTGYAKSLINIEKTSDGTYGGTIIKILSHTGYTPEKYCVDCPEPFTHKPIEGLKIMWGLLPDSADSGLYRGGKILDPLSGHLLTVKIIQIRFYEY
jgi:uncharacterized protein (DUF2147 family)